MSTTNEHTERAELIRQFEQAVHRKGELWERCQGKGWPKSESDEFRKLRDETIPTLRAAMLEAQPAEQAKGQEAVNHEPSISCNHGKDQHCSNCYTTTPPAQPAREWVGLTDEERLTMWAGDNPRPTLGKNKVLEFASAIESKLREKNAGLPAAVPDGWHFYTADFSMQACGKSAIGSVMLIRDMEGQKAWHALGDEDKERVELYVSGKGATVLEAVADAASKAMLAASPKPQPPADDHPLMHSRPAAPGAPDLEPSD